MFLSRPCVRRAAPGGANLKIQSPDPNRSETSALCLELERREHLRGLISETSRLPPRGSQVSYQKPPNDFPGVPTRGPQASGAGRRVGCFLIAGRAGKCLEQREHFLGVGSHRLGFSAAPRQELPDGRRIWSRRCPARHRRRAFPPPSVLTVCLGVGGLGPKRARVRATEVHSACRRALWFCARAARTSSASATLGFPGLNSFEQAHPATLGVRDFRDCRARWLRACPAAWKSRRCRRRAPMEIQGGNDTRAGFLLGRGIDVKVRGGFSLVRTPSAW